MLVSRAAQKVELPRPAQQVQQRAFAVPSLLWIVVLCLVIVVCVPPLSTVAVSLVQWTALTPFSVADFISGAYVS